MIADGTQRKLLDIDLPCRALDRGALDTNQIHVAGQPQMGQDLLNRPIKQQRKQQTQQKE